MMLQLGQAAPPFQARSDDGRLIDLTALRGQWVVLYFYPRANTPGCSVEAQRFEQALPELERLNAVVIGVSADTEAKLAHFRDTCTLTFPLLPDSKRTICAAYGVMGGLPGLLGMAARQTFLINPQGQLAHIWRKVNPSSHVGDVLRVLQGLSSITHD